MTISAIASSVLLDTTIAMQTISQCRTDLQQRSRRIRLDFVAECIFPNHERQDQTHPNLGFLHDQSKIDRTNLDIRICLDK